MIADALARDDIKAAALQTKVRRLAQSKAMRSLKQIELIADADVKDHVAYLTAIRQAIEIAGFTAIDIREQSRRLRSQSGTGGGHEHSESEEVIPPIPDESDRFNTDILRRKPYWGRQREICRAIADPSVRTIMAITGNGVGKSHLAAGLALWYALIHDEPAKVITTGPTFDQLRAVLWGNIFRAYHGCELEGTAVALQHHSLLIQWEDEWFVKGINPDNMESASGYHGGNLIAIIDEASALTAAKSEAIDSWDVAKKS